MWFIDLHLHIYQGFSYSPGIKIMLNYAVMITKTALFDEKYITNWLRSILI